jgi:hypothetical protein
MEHTVMKSTLVKSALAIALLLTGFLAGLIHSSQTPTASVKTNKTQCTSYLADKTTSRSTQNRVAQLNISPNKNNLSESDIISQLSDSNIASRLEALFHIWRYHLANHYHDEISNLAYGETDQQVSSLALWILQDGTDREITTPSQNDLTLSDYQDPEQQIFQSLNEDTNQHLQSNEISGEEIDFLEPMQELTEEEQIEYIKELTELHEDQGVEALIALIKHYNPEIKNTAIDGLISLLEIQTGHFDMIAKSLEAHDVFLNDVQLRRFQNSTKRM